MTYGLAVVVERALSFLLLPFLTRALSVEAFGIWSQVVVTASVICNLVVFNLQTGFVNFFSGRAASETQAGFRFCVKVGAVNSLIVIAIAAFFAAPLSEALFGDPNFAYYSVLLSALIATEVGFEIFTGYLRAEQQIAVLSRYYLAKYVGRMAVLISALVFLKFGLARALGLLILWQLFQLIHLYVKHIRTDIVPAPTFNRSELLHFSLMLTPIALITWLNNFVDRYLILHLIDLAAVGTYAVAYAVTGGAIAIFSVVISYPLYPKLSALWNQGRKQDAARLFPLIVHAYFFLVIPAVAGLTLLGQELIALLSTKSYASDWKVILFLAVGTAVFGLYQILVYPALLEKRTRANLLWAAVAAIVNVVLNLVLLPMLGILGAAVATLLSNLVLAVWAYRESQASIQWKFPWRGLSTTLAGTAVMGIPVYLFTTTTGFHGWVNVGISVFLGGVLYLITELSFGARMLKEFGLSTQGLNSSMFVFFNQRVKP